ncbi:hypothetical protein CLOLEP_01866 [[Clostridium] leptum DSM 753]|uniref:Uncharacterized protein n=1 Tax=[Clostridium] leptum DSM 753 TaxID=428125 RepID=A7VTH4_9FIRM|nr:hypothetical protein CLOLEP_01866 [[Clostridium] leptum DSM 753]
MIVTKVRSVFWGKALQNTPFTVKFSRKNSCFFIFPML